MATYCKSCRAPITWEQTPSGKAFPVSLATGESHFFDCPNARKHRKPRQPKGPVKPLGLPAQPRELPS